MTLQPLKEVVPPSFKASSRASFLSTSQFEEESEESCAIFVLAGKKVESEFEDHKEIPKAVKILLNEYHDIVPEKLPSRLPHFVLFTMRSTSSQEQVCLTFRSTAPPNLDKPVGALTPCGVN